MATAREAPAGAGSRPDLDRLIEALEGPVARRPIIRYGVRRPGRFLGYLLDKVGLGQPSSLRFVPAVAERDLALQALARAALEQVKTTTVTELADRLEESVEALEAERAQAAQIEGSREPDDPFEILKVLPQQYHDEFLADYRHALRAAYPAEGFLALRRMLRQWRTRADWYADSGFQEKIASLERGERPEAARSWHEVRSEHESTGRWRWR